MGVPGFFKQLIIKNKKCVASKYFYPNTDCLMIDANCMLHPQCFRALHEHPNWQSISFIENIMLSNIESYLHHIIECTKPRKLIYIAIDGVAPMAKIKQQRYRRYKSAYEQEHTENNEYQWSNVCISPGTKFMDKIVEKIKSFIHERLVQYKEQYGAELEIIFSTPYTPGEGEHKILQYIKQDKCTENMYVVYGLDADLIFLCLCSQRNHMFLLREATVIKNDNNNAEFSWVSIDIVKQTIVNWMLEKQQSRNIDERLINDFIVLCFFMGNDFLPTSPSLHISNYALDNLLDAYAKCTDYIVENNINFNTVKQLVGFLQYREGQRIKRMISKHKNYVEKTQPEQKAAWEYINMKYENINIIDVNTEHWKKRYSDYCFVDMHTRTPILEAYCQGLEWVSQYYFHKCPCWQWHYLYDHAPLLSDVYYFLNNNDLYQPPSFVLLPPLSPIEQLMIIIPPKYKFMLPKPFGGLMIDKRSPLYKSYPTDIKFDVLFKTKRYETIPILPLIQVDTIQQVVNYVTHSKYFIADKQTYQFVISKLMVSLNDIVVK